MRPHLVLAALSLLVPSGPSGAQDAPGSILAALSDTDMVPTVYETGDLGPADPRHRDTLSLISGAEGRLSARPLEVSNSTNGPPGSLDLSPDGRFAFVAETFRPRSPGMTKLSELVPGTGLRSVDIRPGRDPAVIDQVKIGTRPQAIHLSPDGGLIVAVTTDADRELSFIPVRDGRFGAVTRFGLDLPPSGGFIPLKSTWVQWHPGGRHIAVNLVDRAQVAFYAIERDAAGSVAAMRPWGNRVQTNKFPFVGRFSPDGRFYVTSDLQWGVDTQGFFGVREGILTTIRLAEPGSDGDAARHTVPHIALGGWGSETIAFSPDGRFLVTSNLRGTGKPDGSPDWTREASLSLYELDGGTGRLTPHGDWPIAAVLPQGLAFDRDGRTLFVGVNRTRDGSPGGAVEVWRISTEDTPVLEPTGERIGLPPGVHTLVAR
ncbi:beta-propeller fold lactonase family protein [Inquilinus sp. CA228]|uniref:beta-propeller fold lactonase family protein n=1 Tax=Inquilinus sp. CA228 TaxID=3455609 RepID=UPI003F8D7118